MSSDSTPTPTKETVYNGPEVDLFKPKDPKARADSSRETVHSGDVPEHISRRYSATQVAQLSKSQNETVHEGAIPEMFAKLGRIAHDLLMPDRETIYQGPEVRIKRVEDVTYFERGETAKGEEPPKETVFNETTFVAKKVDTSASRGLVTRMVQRASVRFFAVAALSLLEMYICRNNLAVVISSGIMFVAFSVVGVYTFKLNLKALLFAMGIYGCTTIFMVMNAIIGDGIFVMLVPLLSRGFMIYNLLRTYGLLVDLHLLEAEIY